jgi:hypothetical protein
MGLERAELKLIRISLNGDGSSGGSAIEIYQVRIVLLKTSSNIWLRLWFPEVSL